MHSSPTIPFLIPSQLIVYLYTLPIDCNCNCSSSSLKILTSWSKKVVVTEAIEDGVWTTTNLLVDVSGQGAVVVINNVRVVMTGCVVLAVQPRLGGKLDIEVHMIWSFWVKSHHSPLSPSYLSSVQTTSSLHLGTVSGKVTLGVEVAVLPLKMIGCVVLAVLLEPGVPTISSLHLGIVHGVEGTAKRPLTLTSVPVGEYCQLSVQ